MFEHTLAGSTPTGPSARVGPVSAALVLHAGVLAGLAAVSMLTLRPVPSDPISPLEVFLPQAPPFELETKPPAAAAPRRSGGAPGRPGPVRPLQPDRVPDAIPDVDASGPPAISEVPSVAGEGSGTGTGPFGEGEGTGIGPGSGGGSGEGEGFGPVPLGAGVAAPRLIVKVQPDYPTLARKARLEGEVVLRAVVAPDGMVINVEVVRSTNPVFDGAALEAVRRWRYTPPTQGGRPVSVWFEVVVKFNLR